MCVLVYSHGRTALHWAARDGHFDIVSVLLKHNAKVDVKDMYVFFCVLVYVHTHTLFYFCGYVLYLCCTKVKYFTFLFSFVLGLCICLV